MAEDGAAVDGPVLLFDGVCNLCTGAVQFVLPRDPEGAIRFASLQSDVGRRLLDRCGRSPDELSTVVLVEGDDCYVKSAAAIRVARHLGWPYAALAVFRALPRSIRDAVYDFVAERRYDWFGRRESCLIPSADVSDRFLDAGDDRSL
ncbi:thiol-disulfide oxidoreductase DCC family protein [Haloplanus sp. GCM10025708]|uniref:thiol-disulfide oxidoreductase DCC family protein n=1 Tax=Haloferacaceae TaxID=1644056 RepID=UPI003620B1D9